MAHEAEYRKTVEAIVEAVFAKCKAEGRSPEFGVQEAMELIHNPHPAEAGFKKPTPSVNPVERYEILDWAAKEYVKLLYNGSPSVWKIPTLTLQTYPVIRIPLMLHSTWARPVKSASIAAKNSA